MFHCRTHAWDSDEREMRRGDRMVTRGRREERRQNGDEREKRGGGMATRGRREGEETGW